MKNKKYTSQGFPIIWEEVEAEDEDKEEMAESEEVDIKKSYADNFTN